MASLYRKPVILRDPRTGQRIKTKSKKWWGRFVDAAGREKRVPLAVDRAAALALLNEHVRRAERERAGLIESTDEHRKRPLAKHLADYERYLHSKQSSPRYVELAVARVKTIVAGCRFRSISDFSPSKVLHWLRDQRDRGQFGIATSNDYLVAIKAFANWLVRDGRLATNRLKHLQRLNAETDVRRQRRVLAPDELERLVQAAAASRRTIDRLAGPDRTIVYRLAALTGLRAQELASLTPRSFDLDGEPPTVRVEACYSKHRRTDILPLAESLVQELRSYLVARDDQDERRWPGKWYRKAAALLRHDLAVARKAWLAEVPAGTLRMEREQSDYLLPIDSAGCVADFHSLRHGFITYLVAANVPPKVAQTLARHSTITLTMDRYTHLGVVDLVAAVQRLPHVSGAASDSAAS